MLNGLVVDPSNGRPNIYERIIVFKLCWRHGWTILSCEYGCTRACSAFLGLEIFRPAGRPAGFFRPAGRPSGLEAGHRPPAVRPARRPAGRPHFLISQAGRPAGLSKIRPALNTIDHSVIIRFAIFF